MEPKPLFGGKGRKPMPWYPLPYMEMYLEKLKADDLSQSHRSMMKIAMAYFGLFAQTKHIRHPEEIERIHLLHFQAWLIQDAKKQDGGPLAVSYQRTIMTNLRLWFRWLEKEGHITETPWVRIKVGWHKKMSHKLDDEEIAAVFEAHRRQAFRTSPFYFHRREAILTVLFVWGLTLTEIRSLNIPNVDMRQDVVVIRYRGGRSRQLPYGTELKNVISRYLSQRPRHAQPTEDALFIDTTGGRMTADNLYKVLKDLGETAGVNLSPQRLRDTYGYKLVKSGMHPQIARDLLGLSRTSGVAPFDPKVGEKHAATQKLEDEVAALLGHDQPAPEYRRL